MGGRRPRWPAQTQSAFARPPPETVRETFELAHRLCSPEPPPDTPAAARAAWTAAVDDVIDVLELRDAQHTKIGNAKVRGLSGGQKKRVTIGEALLSGARVLALDEVTSGLDSSTALGIVTFLRQWAHVSCGTVVVALQAPTPEILAKFDDGERGSSPAPITGTRLPPSSTHTALHTAAAAAIVLSGGYELFHGPPSGLAGYLSALGYRQPAFTDVADFAVQFATSPTLATALSADAARAAGIPTAECGAPVSTSVPELAALWRHSVAGRAVMGGAHPAATPRPETRALAALDDAATAAALNGRRAAPGDSDAFGVVLSGPAAERQFGLGGGGGAGFLATLLLLLWRQQRLLWRNPALVGAKLGQSVFLGCVLGSLFYQPPRDAFTLRAALMLFVPVMVSYSSQSEVPIVRPGRRVPPCGPGQLHPPRALQSQAFFSGALVRRQVASGMYSSLAYVIAAFVSNMPLQVRGGRGAGACRLCTGTASALAIAPVLALAPTGLPAGARDARVWDDRLLHGRLQRPPGPLLLLHLGAPLDGARDERALPL